jgi:Fe-S-cluster containining protein
MPKADCEKCNGKCCRYFCFQIDEPESFDEFEDVRWYLLHEGVSVHVDEGDWYMSILNPCKALGPDNRCSIYEERPLICRSYSQDNCDATGGGYEYEQLFESPEQLEAFARKTLGDKKYEKARDKARAKLDKKHKKKKKKTKSRKKGSKKSGKKDK